MQLFYRSKKIFAVLCRAVGSRSVQRAVYALTRTSCLAILERPRFQGHSLHFIAQSSSFLFFGFQCVRGSDTAPLLRNFKYWNPIFNKFNSGHCVTRKSGTPPKHREAYLKGRPLCTLLILPILKCARHGDVLLSVAYGRRRLSRRIRRFGLVVCAAELAICPRKPSYSWLRCSPVRRMACFFKQRSNLDYHLISILDCLEKVVLLSVSPGVPHW